MGAAFAHSRSQKPARVVAPEQCLGIFQRNSKKFLLRYVTVDETWTHYYTPETKNLSKMWTGPGETRFFSRWKLAVAQILSRLAEANMVTWQHRINSASVRLHLTLLPELCFYEQLIFVK